MDLSFEIVDRFQATFVDFWRLRPRRFLEAADVHAGKYLSPAQFLAASAALILMLLVTANALIRREQVTLLGYEPAAAEALAGRVVVFIVSMHVVNTLFYQWISRWWPVRASQPFARYFAFSCYMMAIYLPMAALEVLLDPIVFMLVASNKASQLLLFLPLAIGGAVGFVIFWIYTNPGMAYINGVSATRMALATMLWTTSIFFTGGMLVGVLLTLMRG